MHILIVGAGQVGSRHLQALSLTKLKIQVSVIDPSNQSLKKTKIRWKEVVKKKSSISINFYKSVSELSTDVDVALITTSSYERLNVIKQLVNLKKVKYWILEKVLAQSESDIDKIKKETNTLKSINCWVNNPRRIMDWHKKLRKNIINKGPLEISYSAESNWGLACNSIHFIDLTMWWSGEVIKNINTTKLDKKWFKAKRKGYFEVNGELSILFSKGSKLTIRSNSNIRSNLIKVSLNDGTQWIINEKLGKAFNSKKKILNGKYEFQSKMTHKLIEQIFKENKCDLPNIVDSAKAHKPFIKAMLKHWNKSNSVNQKYVPIT